MIRGLPINYSLIFREVEDCIQKRHVEDAPLSNRETILLYCEIGLILINRLETINWVDGTLQQLAKDLRGNFPGTLGFSEYNLRDMTQFAKAYNGVEFLQQSVAKISWSHNKVLLKRLNTIEARLWYAGEAAKHGWGLTMLIHQIDARLYLTHRKLVASRVHKQAVRKALIDQTQRFLVELGKGFAFVGRLVHLDVGGKDYYIDLLFYHLKLRSYVIVDLKDKEFDARDIEQLNFYLSAVDDFMRHPDDQPSIGLLLCKSRDRITAKYASKGIRPPIGAAGTLAQELKDDLPTVEQLEEEFGKDVAKGAEKS